MSILINVIIVGALFFLSYKFHVLLGIAFTAAFVAFICYYYYSAFMYTRANAEFLNKNYDKAFEYYEKAYKSKNRKYTVDLSYAQALLRTGKPEKALEIVNDVLKYGRKLKNEIRYPALQTRIMINYKTGKMEEAYEEAVELFEDGVVTSNMYCLLGLLMLEKGEPIEKTLELCEKAYDYDSDNRDNVDNLLVCYIKTNNLEKAKELADNITEEFPTFTEGWYHSAQVYSMLGDKKKAAENLEKIKDCDRNYLTTISEEEIESFAAKLR